MTLRADRYRHHFILHVMLASAVPSGNHYVADVIAGVVVAGLAIARGGAIQAWLDRLFAYRRNFYYAPDARPPPVHAPRAP